MYNGSYEFMNLGFDFDKVFINTPPLIPDKLVNFLYKGYLVKRRDPQYLKYRFPNKIEQQIRILSHHPTFRKPIDINIKVLGKICKEKNIRSYLISSRFGFLKKRTEDFLDKHKLKSNFHGMYFNFKNEQPHKFKLRMIKKLKIQIYIDDDLDLLVYLANKFPKNNFFWLTENRNHNYKSLPKNIKIIKSLKELYNKYL